MRFKYFDGEINKLNHVTRGGVLTDGFYVIPDELYTWYRSTGEYDCQRDGVLIKDSRIFLMRPDAISTLDDMYFLDIYKNYIPKKPRYFLDKIVEEKNKVVHDKKQIIQNLRKDFTRQVEDLKFIEYSIEKLKKEVNNLSKYNMDSRGNILVEFKDVYANDVRGYGEEIFLGDLVFSINLETASPRIVSGTEPIEDNKHSSPAYVPHQISDEGGICLGTQDSDFIEAVKNFDIDVATVILKRFAETYNSEDSAGKSWVAWHDPDEWESEQGVWSEYYNDYIDEDYAVYSDYHASYLHSGNAVYSEESGDYYDIDSDAYEVVNGVVYPAGSDTICWDDIEDNYILSDESVTLYDGNVTHESNAVQLPDGDYILSDDAVKVENGDYARPEDVVELYDGADVLKTEAVEIDGEYYRLSEVEEVDGVYRLIE